jgi:competence protein ComEA
MIKSLLLKLGMLFMAIGVVFWVRWAPQPPVHDASPTTENRIVASQTTELEGREGRTAGSSGRSAQGLTIDAVAQTEPSKTAIGSRLDINRASAGELESLPGIGSVLAKRVIAFRESVGQFQKVEDLRGVKGIGSKQFERIKPLVTVSTPHPGAAMEQRAL